MRTGLNRPERRRYTADAMDLEFLTVAGAPPSPPTAPYSHAARAGGTLFVTGQLPTDPRAGDRLVAGGIVEQTHRVMRNLETGLRALAPRSTPWSSRGSIWSTSRTTWR